MISKVKPASVRYFETYKPYGAAYPSSNWSTETRSQGSDSITYDNGPKVRDGHNIWKRCYHDTNGVYFGSSPRINIVMNNLYMGCAYRWAPSSWSPGSYTLQCPSVENVASEFWNEIDLNCHDSVLLYSGILQAVPLVGGAFKFVKIMNDLGRKLSKDFRKRPFVTVLKSAISLDFIDRFVVSPTIDDARKFINASNYVINVLNTAYEANGLLPKAYESSGQTSRVISTDTYTSRQSWSSRDCICDVTRKRTEQASTSTYILASVRYNTDAIDPIKLWATRIGLTRPLDSVWDLVPFSFVVDYFTRAGDFISQLGSELTDQDGLRGKVQDIYGAWYTQKNEFLQEETFSVPRTLVPVGTGDWQFRIDGIPMNGQWTFKKTRFVRDTFNPFECNIGGPHGFFNIDLSLTRGRTLAELFIQSKLRR